MTCPKCSATDAPGTVREEGQHGRTRCGACNKATPNRSWPDFDVVLSEREQQANLAKSLAIVGMSAMTAADAEVCAALAEVSTDGKKEHLSHAYAVIVAGFVLRRYDEQKPVRKAVNGALSFTRGN